MADSDLLTAAKWAAEWGVSAGKVKKAIEKGGIEPDKVKSGCKYYGSDTASKIKAQLDD